MRRPGSGSSPASLIHSGRTVIVTVLPVSTGIVREDPLSLAQVHDQKPTLPAVHPHRDQVRGADEPGHERRRRPLVKLARRRELLDDPLFMTAIRSDMVMASS